jgi:hypothetical protein
MNRIEEFIADFDPDKQEILYALRKAVHGISRQSIPEDIKWNALCFFKSDRAFVGLMPYKSYISVIFDRGAELADEPGVLEGSGKLMRHIKIRKLEEVKQKKVAQYIRHSFSI